MSGIGTGAARAVPQTAASTSVGRLRLIGAALGADATGVDAAGIMRSLDAADLPATREGAYLVLAVLRGEIPDVDDVLSAARRWRGNGLGALLTAETKRSRLRPVPPVRLSSAVIVDVTDTARSAFMTGIQRVATESVARWPQRELELVAWDGARRRLHALSDDELARFPSARAAAPASRRRRETIVPYRAAYVLPEIAVAHARYRGILAIARHSGSHAVAIGFDCIPITSGEFAGPGMSGAFANYLAALAAFDDIVAISGPSADEFRGWQRMIAGAGLSGPRISSVELPFSAGQADDVAIARTRTALDLAEDLPVVLSVGSHEPRKNHVTFLHAAELLWQQGHRFQIVMVGGNSWNSASFELLVEQLQAKGRPLITVSRASDEIVWSLYRLARFSVFCSFNEGFGLPVAESLAAGTPVITSDFGSMRELAAGHGGLVVDPADPGAIRSAMQRLLDGDDELDRLRGQLDTLPRTGWDDYAAAVWQRVVTR